MKETINKGIANPHTQHQRIANPLELGAKVTFRVADSFEITGPFQGTTLQSFLQCGKLTNASDLDYIYAKVRNL